MIRIAVALALMCTQALAAGPRYEPNLALKGDHFELAWDEGGFLQPYNVKFRLVEGTGFVVRVKAMCSSACTLVLRNTMACAEPRAVFGFHQARTVSEYEVSERGSKFLWAEYPATVKAKVGQLTPDLAYIKGTELLPACQ